MMTQSREFVSESDETADCISTYISVGGKIVDSIFSLSFQYKFAFVESDIVFSLRERDII